MAHPSSVNSCSHHPAEGATSLRLLQGRVRCTNPLRLRPWFPPFTNCAQDGHPTALVIPAKSKAWATRSREDEEFGDGKNSGTDRDVEFGDRRAPFFLSQSGNAGQKFASCLCRCRGHV